MSNYIVVCEATGAEYRGTGCEDCDFAMVATGDANAICRDCADAQDMIDVAAIEFLDW